jgi:hypothetical protein
MKATKNVLYQPSRSQVEKILDDTLGIKICNRCKKKISHIEPCIGAAKEKGYCFKCDHYKTMTMQPWDFIIENQLPFCEGNIIKYICRYKNKGGIDDLEKAKHYLEKLIEIENRKNCTW